MKSLAAYLEQLASTSPTPGGGSAATIVAALGASLVAMAARITAGNPRYAPQRGRAHGIASRADLLRERLLEAGSRDEDAFAAVVAARGDARQQALIRAAQEPLRAMSLALDVQRLAVEALDLGNPHLASDAASASEFAAAALAACAYNVRINHRAMNDRAVVDDQRNAMEAYETESAMLLRQAREKAQ
ncbi:MAG TPA: cyclodeaminase/cyclohydrolase family protein [Candidatus Dormibacteraeota bacterium]|nr:cyclodeaminase/cyclohydrolase family protein [Candidatus Dormibacteraeota bacterium]